MVLTMAFLLIAYGLQAQSLTGTVKDATGEAVIGASVLEKGTYEERRSD